MKRRLLWLLLVGLTLLCSACGTPNGETPPMQQPYDFYYRAASVDYDAENGPLAVETRDLGDSALGLSALFELYLQGPQSGAYLTPFPRGLRLREAAQNATTLTLRLSEEYAALRGIDASLADACIVKTALGLPNVRHVRILSEAEDGEVLRSVLLDGSDILLTDRQTDTDTMELTFYFADAEQRYLLTEKQTVPSLPAEQLPQYLVEQLIAGPRTAGLYPTIPKGTVLLDVNVENGVCAVDLSADFLQARGGDALAPHLTLLSLANTLTELSWIDQVQLYVEGSQEAVFAVFPLSVTWQSESRAVGPVHPELREFDGTLYLPVGNDGLLYPLTLRVRNASSEPQAEALLRTLLSFAPQNGFSNPLYGTETPQLQLSQGRCTLTFAAGAFDALSSEARECALRMLVCSLCALGDVYRVSVLCGDVSLLDSVRPDAAWYWTP